MSKTILDKFSQTMLPAIEGEISLSIDRANGPALDEFHTMMSYHLGLDDDQIGSEARGKRIRPLLVLLTSAAAGAEWEKALPAAAAVELIHNFSLIHDDIEDNSPLRRGRPTVWVKWGIPQAINAGDAMFTIAHLAMLNLAEKTSSEIAFKASRILQDTCLMLTQGQYLDIAYEGRGDLSLEAYWPMVGGKTAALAAACTEIGALIAEPSPQSCQLYREFGWSLGLAFQVRDDLLGIWGDAEVTGKSNESDLLTGKKSLPILYALSQRGPFAKRWLHGSIQADEIPELVKQLETEGARQYTEEKADQLTRASLQALEQAKPIGEAGQALKTLALLLLQRQN